ncbi:cupin domain-containing protein [candidate division WOR-3 bacterium]|nr:cupin domain-containing protein [candidate division WOR-3 bacterium]
MKEFPEFMRNPKNAIDPQFQSEGVEGYVYDGVDGSQMAFWTTSKSGSSSEHTHEFDEYFVILEGECILFIDEERIVLRRGDEYHIRKGVPHSTEFVRGTRSIHAFGGKRAKRSPHIVT